MHHRSNPVVRPSHRPRFLAGGIEEDIIKCLAYRGDFSLSCADLRSKGLNRVGYEALKLRYVVFCVNFEDKLLTKLHQLDPMWRCQTSSMESLCERIDNFVKIYHGAVHGWMVRYKDDDEHVVKCAMEAHTDLLNWFTKYLK
ncbi:hypothetical protein L1987_44169 [Smallanthus sonchifolius]|uniref:Uncharacterized protein n=1 Tax=Smallanthus sonchifolius TaxID=185202 RepID=A0ACB9GPR8_9ASTR|nr:hypothetical protein L1987_44169 [Smallanthus sonchifolius]